MCIRATSASRAPGRVSGDYERFFRGKLLNEDLNATAERYRGLDLFGWCSALTRRQPRASRPIETTSWPGVPEHADVFVGFAGIDPWKATWRSVN